MENEQLPDKLLNQLRPDEKVLKGDYPEADARLGAVIYYLKSAIQSIEQRKAYLVEPGYWRARAASSRKGNDVGGKIEIERDYFATMAPAQAEAMDVDEGFKMIARPLISGETVYAFDPAILGQDRRSSGPRSIDTPPTEKEMVQLKRANPKAFSKPIRLSSIRPAREELFFVNKQGADILANFKAGRHALWFEQSTSLLKRKREFAEMLKDAPGIQHKPLKQMLEPSHVWPESPREEIAEEAWIDPSLKGVLMPGAEEQREFVRKALGTEEFALVWGPAGAGKTTAICEFIKQAVRRGRKVLMVGSTHVAVDNVLEKFSPGKQVSVAGDGDDVIAVRVGRAEKVSAEVAPLLMQNFMRREAKRLKQHLDVLIKRNEPESAAAALMLKSLDHDLGEEFMENLGADEESEEVPQVAPGRGALLKMIMDGANLVGGTTLGILAHPAIQAARDSRSYPEFDYLIVDEASKTTLDEFLVPAMCAKRWIIVGDPYQLAPFCEEAELGASLMTALSRPLLLEEHRLDAASSVPVKREIRSAVQYALMERAVRFKGGDYHREMVTKRDQSMETLARYTAELPGHPPTVINLSDLCAQTFGVALPSVLESLIGERPQMLPPPRSLVRPFGNGLASRLVELKYQFRMAPRIANFCKEHVYGGRLLLTAPQLPEKPRLHSMATGDDGRFVVLSADAATLAGIRYQDRERESAAQVALGVWELLQFADWAKRTAATGQAPYKAYLISTYKNQNQLCRMVVEYLEEHHAERFAAVELEANTVDSCQGHEADLVLLSLVRERQTPFMRSLNRMNVAFTRARSRLVLLGDLPAKTEEAQRLGINQTLIDELHDYGPSREVAKGLEEAVDIVNRALS